MQKGMKYVFLSVLVCLLFVYNVGKVEAAGDMAGPADINVERWEDCENPQKYQVPMGVTMAKINRTHAGMTSCLELGSPMDENVILNVDVAKWGDGGWKPNALNHVGAACDTVMKYIKEPWEAFIHAAGYDDEVKCPLPEGKYCIDKVTFDLTGLFPSMLYGYFRVDATLTVKGAPHRCLRMYVKSDPAKKGF